MQSYDGVPQILKDLTQWVCWKHEVRNGNPTKLPYDAKQNHSWAKSNDSKTWATFDQALEAANDPLKDFDGVGFMLHGTALVGIDFDGVMHDGVAEPYVLEILAQLSNPYCEITPSGNGLRAFVQCDSLPAGQRKFTGSHYGAEIYSGSEGGRYLTVTGNQFAGVGVPKIDDLRVAYLMVSQIRNDKFKKLWMGDLSEHNDDPSRADLALMSILAKIVNSNPVQMEAAFACSKLGMREKWLNRADYRTRTIKKALGVKVVEPEPEPESDREPDYEHTPTTKKSKTESVTPAREGILRTGNTVKVKRIQWFWKDRVPFGKITLFAGNPDNGKSMASTSLAAICTTGGKFPDGANDTPPSEVLMLLGEDDLDDTAAPRMVAAGADMSKVHFLDSVKQANLPEKSEVRLDWDVPMLDTILATHPNIRLHVVDPISNYLGGVNMIAEQEVRSILIPLKRLAEKHNIAVIIVMHLNKKSDMDAITRVGGAMAFTGVARCSWLFVRDEDEDGRKLETFSMLRLKNNLAKATNSGLAYTIESVEVPEPNPEHVWAPRLVWLGAVDMSADQALGSVRKGVMGRPQGTDYKMQDAVKFLETALADGPRNGKVLIEDAKQKENITEITLRRAAKEMELRIFKSAKQWMWEMPEMQEDSATVETDDAPEVGSMEIR